MNITICGWSTSEAGSRSQILIEATLMVAWYM